MRIILIGYMGAGKTTVGRALAKALQLPFYDLDWYIASRHHKNAEVLFPEIGEEAFRRIEHSLLHEVAEFDDVVLSCGGGTPCFFDNMDYINRQGISIYLRASVDVLCKHLKMARVQRPLLAGKTDEEVRQYITTHLQEREPFYLKAQHTVDISLLDTHSRINHTIQQIINLIDNPPSNA